jgi:raffinose/stachyose/melibiose transport system permease protein
MKLRRVVLKKITKNTLYYVLVVIITTAMVFPIFVLVNNAFKENRAYVKNPLSLPVPVQLKNFVDAWKFGGVAEHLLNTIIIVVFGVAGIFILSCLAAFGISRLEGITKLGTVIFVFFVAGIMVPQATLIVKLFLLLKDFKLVNKHLGVLVAYYGARISFPIFLMTGFFRAIPKELFDSVEIDGCGPIRQFYHIVLPLSRPIVATVVILHTVWLWNDYLYPYIILTSDKKTTIQVGLQNLVNIYFTKVPVLFAGVIFTILPLITVYIIFQKEFIEGLTRGALKG